MHPLIEKYIKSRGIEDDLTAEEKALVDKWQAILVNKEISIEDIHTFCEAQLALIESQFGSMENSSQKNDRLVLLHSVYKRLLGLLTSKQKEREQLEAHITTMLLSK